MAVKGFKRILSEYDYKLPSELIAQKPAVPRDSARLLIYDRSKDKIYFDAFKNLCKFLPKNAVLVLNNTKVIPARLTLSKETGGKVRVLYIGNSKSIMEFLSDRKLNIGSSIHLNKEYSFKVLKQTGSHYFLKPSFPISKFFSLLEKYGSTPIPPYIKNSPLSEKALRKEYQSIFASVKGSVAAPTASLHFTDKLIQKIKKSGHQIAFVTLHVNLGTFAPLKERNIKNKKLHQEYFEIDKETKKILESAKQSGKWIVAVGTTVARTLESAFGDNGKIKKLSGETELFIDENYKIKAVDSLITNFHVPQSSLMMLVSAFTGRKKLIEIYEKAIKNKFSFFSFGDGMLVI